MEQQPKQDTHTDTTEVPKNERDWALIAHLSAIVVSFVGPLVVWLIKKDEMPYVNKQAKECLNFQITIAIATAVCTALTTIFIGFLLLPVVMVGNIVLLVMAAVKASEGKDYRYPLTLRLIS